MKVKLGYRWGRATEGRRRTLVERTLTFAAVQGIRPLPFDRKWFAAKSGRRHCRFGAIIISPANFRTCVEGEYRHAKMHADSARLSGGQVSWLTRYSLGSRPSPCRDSAECRR